MSFCILYTFLKFREINEIVTHLTNLDMFFIIRYTYGQPVRGKVDIEVYLSYYKPNSKYYSKITKMEDVSFEKFKLLTNLLKVIK